MSTTLKLGDRVRLDARVAGYHDLVGQLGRVMEIRPSEGQYGPYGVRFDKFTDEVFFEDKHLTLVYRHTGLDSKKATQLWEDYVGDSGKAPTTEELTKFAKSVEIKALVDASESLKATAPDDSDIAYWLGYMQAVRELTGRLLDLDTERLEED